MNEELIERDENEDTVEWNDHCFDRETEKEESEDWEQASGLFVIDAPCGELWKRWEMHADFMKDVKKSLENLWKKWVQMR